MKADTHKIITLEGEIGVVGDDIAVNVLDTLLHERIGQLLEHTNGVIITLGVQRVGQLASGKVGIASPN